MHVIFAIMFKTNISSEIADESEPEIHLCFLISFLLGAIAAIFSKTVSAPFDRIKIIQQCYDKELQHQTQNSGQLFMTDVEKSIELRPTDGIFSVLKYIYKTQGILSLWRGNLANCLRYVPKFALDMSLKKPIRNYFVELIEPGENQLLNFTTKWISGSLAAMD